jgi:hypothetical protein
MGISNMDCSKTNPELWQNFLTVFRNIHKKEPVGIISEEDCQDFIDDIRETVTGGDWLED